MVTEKTIDTVQYLPLTILNVSIKSLLTLLVSNCKSLNLDFSQKSMQRLVTVDYFKNKFSLIKIIKPYNSLFIYLLKKDKTDMIQCDLTWQMI